MDWDPLANFHLKNKLQNLIECPVCLKVPKSLRIYQCENGHIICEFCNDRVKECPTCRARKPEIRALVAEKLIETAELSLNCAFDSYGCIFKGKR